MAGLLLAGAARVVGTLSYVLTGKQWINGRWQVGPHQNGGIGLMYEPYRRMAKLFSDAEKPLADDLQSAQVSSSARASRVILDCDGLVTDAKEASKA